MADTLQEIVPKILSRVPVLSLLRFRCVSKSWRSMIDSPDFIKLHLNRALETNSDRKIILQSEDFFFADLDLIETTNRIDRKPLQCPLKSRDLVTNVLGSCHGLLCLGGDVEYEDFAIWNPTTRELFNLPSSEFPIYGFRYNSRLGYGFGYDSVNDDYKVLRIIQLLDSVYPDNEFEVFSLKSNSWRKIDPFPYHLKCKRTNGVLVSGSIHWLVSRNRDAEDENLIVAFDLETEEYRLVPQPDYPTGEGKFHMNVVALGGSLCVICNYHESNCAVIWVMRSYMAKESWTKLLTIGGRDDGNKVGPFRFVKPVAYSRSGGEVFIVQDDILALWYDLESGEISYAWLNSSESLPFVEHQACFGSLVRLGGRVEA